MSGTCGFITEVGDKLQIRPSEGGVGFAAVLARRIVGKATSNALLLNGYDIMKERSDGDDR